MTICASLASEITVRGACTALAVPRASFYRWKQRPSVPKRKKRLLPPLALSQEEEQAVLDVLHEDRFVDLAPAQVHAALLDEGRWLCSVRTMYRLLARYQEVRERRNQMRHPHYAKPELLAERPNEVWSWDITKLKGPVKWNYCYLYVILDIFSRYVVGWMIAHREQAALAKKLIAETCEKQSIEEDRLTLHADRGSSMTSKSVALLLSDLGVTKSHSRPYVSNDNPYSESQFKTMKYQPEFPERFGSIEDARSFCVSFFSWYNKEHYHSGLGYLTPETVHYGRAEQIIKERQAILQIAYKNHPERFKGRMPHPKEPPSAVWINKPMPERTEHLLV